MKLESTTFGVFPEETGGANYKVRGTVLGQDGSPMASKVAIFQEISAASGAKAPPGFRQIRAFKTGASGQYEVKNLPAGKYTVIAYDKTGQFDPAIKGGLIAEPME